MRVFGFDTAAITDGDEWLRTLDRFGILSDRAVLLDELTVAQNLAMTLTLAIDPIPADVRGRVEALAADVGLAADLLDRKVATLTPAASCACVSAGRWRSGRTCCSWNIPPPPWAAKMCSGSRATCAGSPPRGH